MLCLKRNNHRFFRRTRPSHRIQPSSGGTISRPVSASQTWGAVMLRWAIIFLIVAIVAAVFGFGGIAGEAAWIAKILFVVFLVVFLVSLVLGRRGSRVV